MTKIGLLGWGLIFMSACDFGKSKLIEDISIGLKPPSDLTKLDESSFACSDVSIKGSPWTTGIAASVTAQHTTTNLSSEDRFKLSAETIIVGLNEPIQNSVVEFSLFLPEEMGPEGFIALNSVTENFPRNRIEGDAHVVLVSLKDPLGREWIPLSSGCFKKGLFLCESGVCARNPECYVDASAPLSAYETQSGASQTRLWFQSQVSPNGPYRPVGRTVFPNCSGETCSFHKKILVNGKWPSLNQSGVRGKYLLKYAAISNIVGSSENGGNEISQKKIKTKISISGISRTSTTANATKAFALNVVLVGNRLVGESRTEGGKKALNQVFENLAKIYQVQNIGISQVRSFEWPCEKGGDLFSELNEDDVSEVFSRGGDLFFDGGPGSRAVNLYLVDRIVRSGGVNFLTILGLAGGVPGPFLNKTGASGVAVSVLPDLSTVGDNSDDSNELLTTFVHEIGHFLGLNHPSEKEGTLHDGFTDTPICTPLPGGDLVTSTACLQTLNVFQTPGNESKMDCLEKCPSYSPAEGRFCGVVQECQFNHAMWWTTKNYSASHSSGDGHLFSAGSVGRLRMNPVLW